MGNNKISSYYRKSYNNLAYMSHENDVINRTNNISNQSGSIIYNKIHYCASHINRISNYYDSDSEIELLVDDFYRYNYIDNKKLSDYR